jgi:hypothetical protein
MIEIGTARLFFRTFGKDAAFRPAIAPSDEASCSTGRRASTSAARKIGASPHFRRSTASLGSIWTPPDPRSCRGRPSCSTDLKRACHKGYHGSPCIGFATGCRSELPNPSVIRQVRPEARRRIRSELAV